MLRFKNVLAVVALPAIVVAGPRSAQESEVSALEIPAIRDFVGDGFGARAATAPAELEQLGRLAGIWLGEQELRRQDGTWAPSPPAIWAWKYTLGGHAVQDLWYQSADALPVYLQHLERDYMLTGLRLVDATTGTWRIAWAANSGGGSPGTDFGTLEGVEEDGRIVIASPSDDGAPLQQIVFSDFTDDSFVWTSSFSRDGGETWMDVMRVNARRLH